MIQTAHPRETAPGARTSCSAFASRPTSSSCRHACSRRRWGRYGAPECVRAPTHAPAPAPTPVPLAPGAQLPAAIEGGFLTAAGRFRAQLSGEAPLDDGRANASMDALVEPPRARAPAPPVPAPASAPVPASAPPPAPAATRTASTFYNWWVWPCFLFLDLFRPSRYHVPVETFQSGALRNDPSRPLARPAFFSLP